MPKFLVRYARTETHYGKGEVIEAESMKDAINRVFDDDELCERLQIQDAIDDEFVEADYAIEPVEE